MLGRLLDAVFGCRHGRYSFPITARRGSLRNEAASLTGTYIVCLNCGREFPYDWKEMKVIKTPSEQRHYPLATEEAS